MNFKNFTEACDGVFNAQTTEEFNILLTSTYLILSDLIDAGNFIVKKQDKPEAPIFEYGAGSSFLLIMLFEDSKVSTSADENYELLKKKLSFINIELKFIYGNGTFYSLATFIYLLYRMYELYESMGGSELDRVSYKNIITLRTNNIIINKYKLNIKPTLYSDKIFLKNYPYKFLYDYPYDENNNIFVICNKYPSNLAYFYFEPFDEVDMAEVILQSKEENKYNTSEEIEYIKYLNGKPNNMQCSAKLVLVYYGATYYFNFKYNLEARGLFYDIIKLRIEKAIGKCIEDHLHETGIFYYRNVMFVIKKNIFEYIVEGPEPTDINFKILKN